MNGGQSRRSPRTTRGAPAAHATIEREKIRHRRPKDHLFVEADAVDERGAAFTQPAFSEDDVYGPTHGDEVVFGDHDDGDGFRREGSQEDVVFDNDAYSRRRDPDWTEAEDDTEPVEVWDDDDEAEDDWVLASDGEPRRVVSFDDDDGFQGDVYAEDGDGYVQKTQGYVEDDDEGGVVWEDEAFPDQGYSDDFDEVAFGRQDSGERLGPEVELAGRRDTRPKPPRPAPPPRQPEQAPPQNRRPQTDRPARVGPDVRRPPADRATFTPEVLSAERGQFSQTRSAPPMPGGRLDEQILQQPKRGGLTQRRRQPLPAGAPVKKAGPRRAVRRGGARGKGLIIAAVLALLAVGGWFAYQAIGAGGIGPAIERLTALIPLPNASRTASDTSFGEGEAAQPGSPEQALADLEQRIQERNGGAATPAVDPATTRSDGPPIPKFKPLPGATRSLSPAGNGEQVAANDGDGQAGEPSLFEQLWRYINPG